MLGFARWLGMLVMTVTLLCGARASAQDTPRAPLHGSCAELPASERQGVARRQSMDDMEVSELLVRLQRPTFVSPPRTSGPTTVGIALEVLEISELDAGTNTFTMEGYLDLVWCDPREAFDPDKVGADREIFLERDAEKELDYIWWPDFYFANEVGPRRVENEELILSPDGTVEYRERFGVTLATDFAMRQFPFDTQQLEIHLQSFAWKTDDLVFVVQDNVLELSPEFEILEWDVVGFDEHTSGVGDGEYSELIAELTVSRDPGFYITKIMIPARDHRGLVVGGVLDDRRNTRRTHERVVHRSADLGGVPVHRLGEPTPAHLRHVPRRLRASVVRGHGADHRRERAGQLTRALEPTHDGHTSRPALSPALPPRLPGRHGRAGALLPAPHVVAGFAPNASATHNDTLSGEAPTFPRASVALGVQLLPHEDGPKEPLSPSPTVRTGWTATTRRAV